jgi:hypothetical protein
MAGKREVNVDAATVAVLADGFGPGCEPLEGIFVHSDGSPFTGAETQLALSATTADLDAARDYFDLRAATDG